MIEAKLRRDDVSAPDRYRYTLTARELKRLRRAQSGAPSTDVAIWRPRLFSAARLARLFGVRAIGRRKRQRY